MGASARPEPGKAAIAQSSIAALHTLARISWLWDSSVAKRLECGDAGRRSHRFALGFGNCLWGQRESLEPGKGAIAQGSIAALHTLARISWLWDSSVAKRLECGDAARRSHRFSWDFGNCLWGQVHALNPEKRRLRKAPSPHSIRWRESRGSGTPPSRSVWSAVTQLGGVTALPWASEIVYGGKGRALNREKGRLRKAPSPHSIRWRESPGSGTLPSRSVWSAVTQLGGVTAFPGISEIVYGGKCTP